jgi:HAD superfamily hydrolase (TIGR01662 family)
MRHTRRAPHKRGRSTRRRRNRNHSSFHGITHVYFDWSRTLAKRDMRTEFIYGPVSQKRSVLYPDTLDVLRTLANRGYTLGIITNTSHDPEAFKAAVKDAGLTDYLRGAIVVNRDAPSNGQPVLCRKPCASIFRAALAADGVPPSAALMVGDKLFKDVGGAKRIGMHGFHKKPNAPLSKTLLNLL